MPFVAEGLRHGDVTSNDNTQAAFANGDVTSNDNTQAAFANRSCDL
jgi:hypothetical protein